VAAGFGGGFGWGGFGMIEVAEQATGKTREYWEIK
jgi:hypothetical protein